MLLYISWIRRQKTKKYNPVNLSYTNLLRYVLVECHVLTVLDPYRYEVIHQMTEVALGTITIQ